MWRHIVSLGQSHGPKIYHNWLQRLYLKISVTIVSVINSIIPNRLQKTLEHAKSTLDDRYTLVEHVIDASHIRWAHFERSFDGTRSHTLWKRWENATHTVLTRWYVVFETLDTRLEHANRWLTGTLVRFSTCWWFSHTIFTRSRHSSRCDGALIRFWTTFAEKVSTVV